MELDRKDIKRYILIAKAIDADICDYDNYDIEQAFARNQKRITAYSWKQKYLNNALRIAAILLLPFILSTGFLSYLYINRLQEDKYISYLEVVSAPGIVTQMELPDKSKVWLNAGSSLRYPSRFTGDERTVYLSGEGYFEVQSDRLHPFYVSVNEKMKVKAHGTKFNVKAYANDANITTTLTSGKVEVSTQSRPPQTLKPNEQLTYDKSTSDIEISTVDTVDTNSWVKGKIIFTNATAEEIFRTLERRYDTVIDHSTDFSASRRYTVKFLKDENLDEMLNILGDIIGFSYRQSGNKIIITK